jgi:hypothetical protein
VIKQVAFLSSDLEIAHLSQTGQKNGYQSFAWSLHEAQDNADYCLWSVPL